MRSKNKFFERDGYMIGVTSKGEEFLFDKEDFDLVSQHTWGIGTWGYVRCRVRNKEITMFDLTHLDMHRLVMQFPKNDVDHINMNKSDNRKQNLREATRSQNSMNTRKRKSSSSSKYKGVYFRKERNSWVINIRINGKCLAWKSYKSEKIAGIMYNYYACKLFKEFAQINKISIKKSKH